MQPSTGGAVAQSVEQRTENPCVGGSIPPHTTTNILKPLFARVSLLKHLLHTNAGLIYLYYLNISLKPYTAARYGMDFRNNSRKIKTMKKILIAVSLFLLQQNVSAQITPVNNQVNPLNNQITPQNQVPPPPQNQVTPISPITPANPQNTVNPLNTYSINPQRNSRDTSLNNINRNRNKSGYGTQAR